MTRRSPRPARLRLIRLHRTWLHRTWLHRAVVIAAAIVSLAGCVGMPDSGPTGQFTATPQATSARQDYVGLVPYRPGPNWQPQQIVQGFLVASAGYQSYPEIAREYLTGKASDSWNPGWTSVVYDSFAYSGPAPPWGSATAVTVSGTVQAKFTGTGQFVSLGGQPSPPQYHFKLTKIRGQWRIANPPDYLMLIASEFNQLYKPQDVYFASDSSASSSVLVPESVFVPVGAEESSLETNLVKVLLTGQKTWLQNAAQTFPPGTTLGGVTLEGATAVVSLGGTALANALPSVKEQVSAQLAWTLAGSPSGPPPNVTSVELVINGKPWTPPAKICNVTQSRSPVQNQAMYSCWAPFPTEPASFSFVSSSNQLWARCASEKEAGRGDVGQIFAVFGPSTENPSARNPQCSGSGYVQEASISAPSLATLPSRAGVPSMVAVSPSGTWVATYSKTQHTLSIGTSTSSAGLGPVNAPASGTWSDVTALSWDLSNNLWVAQGGSVFEVTSARSVFPVSAPQGITDLSVAPDGVRIAYIAQGKSSLGAIVRGSGNGQDNNQLGQQQSVSINPGVQLGPNLTAPDSLTWYDTNDLIVLDGRGSDADLSEVPVDGQDSTISVQAPVGAVSITAEGSQNALIVGAASDGGNELWISVGLDSSWQPLGVGGTDPSYFG